MMEKFVNEYLPKVNFVLLLVLVVMVSAMVFDHFIFTEKREKASAIVREVEDSKILVVVLRDGIFYVLEGKEVSIESLSPLIIRHQNNVFRKEGRFYLYTKGNVIYVFDMYNENLIGRRKGGGR
jgi:biopolymer transport protein ExbD